LVLKKAIKPQRCRLCPGFDGTWCKVKIFSATAGQEKGLHPSMEETWFFYVFLEIWASWASTSLDLHHPLQT
jgi:hypothetical protein